MEKGRAALEVRAEPGRAASWELTQEGSPGLGGQLADRGGGSCALPCCRTSGWGAEDL